MGRNGHVLNAARRARVGVLVALLLGSALAVVPIAPAGAEQPGQGEVLRRSAATQPAAAVATVPPGFQDAIAWSGFTLPTAVSFAPNGRVYVAEKSGLIKVFTNTSDTTPSTVVDLRPVVHDFWDRGLLGMAVDPQLGTAGHNYLHVLYTYDAAPGQGLGKVRACLAGSGQVSRPG
jgi:glucose/arabinose dehydrogenase